MSKLLVEIDPEGNVRVTVAGVKGASCKDVTKQIEQALGKVTSDKATSEMNEKAVSHVVNSGR